MDLINSNTWGIILTPNFQETESLDLKITHNKEFYITSTHYKKKLMQVAISISQVIAITSGKEMSHMDNFEELEKNRTEDHVFEE